MAHCEVGYRSSNACYNHATTRLAITEEEDSNPHTRLQSEKLLWLRVFFADSG